MYLLLKKDKKMEENNNNKVFQKEMGKGWSLFVLGAILLLAGTIPPILKLAVFYPPHLAGGFGILIMGWGVAILARFGLARKNAGSVKRAMIEENDERLVLIRSRAGNDAFLLSIPATSIGLLLYSAITRGNPEPDYFWYYMVFMTLLPIVVYIVRMSKYAKQY